MEEKVETVNEQPITIRVKPDVRAAFSRVGEKRLKAGFEVKDLTLTGFTKEGLVLFFEREGIAVPESLASN
jgi:hypothetical protein